jgi:hypothetical protein
MGMSSGSHHWSFSSTVLARVLWIIGGLLDAEARYAVWVLALGVDYGGAVVNFYVAALGRSRTFEIPTLALSGAAGLIVVGLAVWDTLTNRKPVRPEQQSTP